MSKTMQYVYKGGVALAALLASLMLLLPMVGNKLGSMNLFDFWEMMGMDGVPAEITIAVLCYSIVFFLGLILAVLAVLSIFVDNKIINMIAKVVAIVLVVLVIVGLICNFVMLDAFQGTMAIGAAGIISAIFGVITAGLIIAEKALVK